MFGSIANASSQLIQLHPDQLLPFAGICNGVQLHIFKLVEQLFIGPCRNAVKRRLVAVQNPP
jgi:hypothetical protein